jgi:hypothetical protein
MTWLENKFKEMQIKAQERQHIDSWDFWEGYMVALYKIMEAEEKERKAVLRRLEEGHKKEMKKIYSEHKKFIKSLHENDK